MAIVIQNVGNNPSPFGEHEYVVRINNDEICRFTHVREQGLATCLMRAAEAVERNKWEQVRQMFSVANG